MLPTPQALGEALRVEESPRAQSSDQPGADERLRGESWTDEREEQQDGGLRVSKPAAAADDDDDDDVILISEKHRGICGPVVLLLFCSFGKSKCK